MQQISIANVTILPICITIPMNMLNRLLMFRLVRVLTFMILLQKSMLQETCIVVRE